MGGERDNLFANVIEQLPSFQFDERTSRVFDDMIVRSVPGYRMTVAMTALIAKHFAQPQSTLYDLGCSHGACLLAMAAGMEAATCRIVGIDNSPAMLNQCQDRLTDAGCHQIELRCEDIRCSSIDEASVVVLNFTLQFVPIEDRYRLLTRIHGGMRPGGVLVISEKILMENDQTDQLLSDLHHQFKRANGYADLEISQKRESLENVLVRESIADHRDRLRSVGFDTITPWLQCFNFVSLFAVKPPFAVRSQLPTDAS